MSTITSETGRVSVVLSSLDEPGRAIRVDWYGGAYVELRDWVTGPVFDVVCVWDYLLGEPNVPGLTRLDRSVGRAGRAARMTALAEVGIDWMREMHGERYALAVSPLAAQN